MEFLDIVNDEDKVIGKAPKKEIYQNKHIHRIIHVLIFNDKNEMALQLRGKTLPFCPDHWSTSVGGHVQSEEKPEIAALREYKEELGETTPITFLFKDFYGDERGLKKFLYTYKSLSNGPFENTSPREVQRVEFFTIETIKQMIENGEKFHPELLFLLKKHYF